MSECLKSYLWLKLTGCRCLNLAVVFVSQAGEAKGQKSCILVPGVPSILHVTLGKFPLAAPISPLDKDLDKISGFLFFSFICPSPHPSWITMKIDRIFIYNHHKLKTTANEWKTSMCYTHTIDHNSARKRRNNRGDTMGKSQDIRLRRLKRLHSV